MKMTYVYHEKKIIIEILSFIILHLYMDDMLMLAKNLSKMRRCKNHDIRYLSCFKNNHRWMFIKKQKIGLSF